MKNQNDDTVRFNFAVEVLKAAKIPEADGEENPKNDELCRAIRLLKTVEIMDERKDLGNRLMILQAIM